MQIKKFLKQNAVQASLIFMAAAVISRLLGLARDMLFSAYFGTTHAADALNATFPITSVTLNITASAIAVSFIPLYIEKINKNREEALNDLSVVFNYIVAGLFVFMMLLIAFAFPLVHVFTPGFKTAELISTTAHLIDLFAIASFMWGIANFLYAVAQAEKHFLITAVVALILNTSIIIFLILFHKSLGVASYAVGMLFGTLLQSAIMLIYEKLELGMRFTFNFNPKGTILPMLIYLSTPLIVQQLATYTVTVVSNNVASSLREGSIAALGYANKLRQFSLGVLTVPLATSYYPFLSEAASKKDYEKLEEIFSKSIRFASFFIIPVTFISIVFSKQLVAIVFQRGAFNTAAVNLTAAPFAYYSIGIFAAMVSIVIMRVFFAMKDMWTPTILTIVSAAINIAIIFPLVRAYQHSGIALAVSIGLYIDMIFLMFFLKRKIGTLGGKKIFISVIKLTVGSTFGIIGMYYAYFVFAKMLPKSNWYVAVNLTATFILFSIIYVIALKALHAEEITTAYYVIKKSIAKLKKA
jgi:putative peptidoglycan lipid II flippase